jgi:hypothetical protein
MDAGTENAHLEGMQISPSERGTSAARPKTKRPKSQRSRVTNGKSPFVEADRRGPWARRWSDLFSQIISDIGGNDAGLSEGQRQLARRCATIALSCEKMEGQAAQGEAFDVELYGSLTDRLGRCFQRLGLRRQMRDVLSPPSVRDYVKHIEAAE